MRPLTPLSGFAQRVVEGWRGMRLFRLALLIAAALALARAAPAEDRITLPFGPGLMEPILYDAAKNPIASVILFVGGDGDLEQMRDTFLQRVRMRFVAAHMSVALPDTPSDQPGGFGPYFRLWKQHTEAVAAVAAFLKQQSRAPVWAVGHSNGTISAANAAQRLGPGVISGVVLASSVWLGGLQQVPVAYLTVPVLEVHNIKDACPVSPVSLARQNLWLFVEAPAKKFVALSGPSSSGDPCGAYTAHDFYDIQNKAVMPIIAWIQANSEP
jgi:pimeloyl-ACP methyl ester carboxylesterase